MNQGKSGCPGSSGIPSRLGSEGALNKGTGLFEFLSAMALNHILDFSGF